MATKREWLRILKAIKKEPRVLLPAECDELISLLGGTVRPNHRPEVLALGKNRRKANWTAIGGIVFGFLENTEQLKKYEADLELLKSLPLPNGDIESEHRKIETENLTRLIEQIRPRCARCRADAERMATDWFASRGVALTAKQIQNELSTIQQTAGLKRLGLAEWRKLK